MEAKKWYFSRTVWVAILQSLIGFLISLSSLVSVGFTPETITAFGVGAKGVFDLYLRLKTSQAID